MALQLYNLRDECRGTGYSIVSEVQQHGPDITEERMDELFKPLIDEFTQRHEIAVEQEHDEIMGQLEDRNEENERQEQADAILSELSENRRIVINGELETYTNYNWYTPKMRVQNDTDVIEIRTVPAAFAADELSYEELIDLSESDKDDYIETVYITTSTIALGQAVYDNMRHKSVTCRRFLEIIKLSGADLNSSNKTILFLLEQGWTKPSQKLTQSRNGNGMKAKRGKTTASRRLYYLRPRKGNLNYKL